MRVLIAVLALVATPVIASVALGQSSTPGSGENRGVRHSDARSGDKDADTEECENDKENSHRWHEGLHKGDKNDDKQCASVGTGGTGGTGSTGSSLGTINGFVFFGSVYTAGAPGVLGGSVQLKSLSGTVLQSTVATFTGSFSFNNSVPAGSYLVCDVPPIMFYQVLPATNGCYPVTIGGTVWVWPNTLYFGLLM